jgi:Domain of unknown function (DUF4124)
MKRVMLFAALLAWSAMASAVVYKWTDAQGKVQYGDRPPDGVHAEVVEGLGGAHTAAPPARPSSSSVSNGTPAANNVTPKDDATKQAVDADVAATREKQCADAQANYKKLIEGRRIYKTGADGERQYLTSDQIDSERINAKREIDATCNSAT